VSFSTPVLLTAHRRPATTAQVIDALALVEPQRLFVALDGPRTDVPGERHAVDNVRRLVEEMVTWPCELTIRASDNNLGCRVAMTSALDWFFGHVEEGIVLEDDCVPHPDFFRYCEELLDRYRQDSRVMCISGDNSARISPVTGNDSSYFFVRQPLVWGWATWRRSWALYDRDLEGWAAMRSDLSQLRRMFPDPVERRFQRHVLDRLRESGRPDTWDYQWDFTLAANNGIAVIPRVNLVSNVGFGPGATHTSALSAIRSDVPTEPILPLRHPTAVSRDPVAERQIADRVHGLAKHRRRGVQGVLLRVRLLLREFLSSRSALIQTIRLVKRWRTSS
jgi:hypothetical protein